MFKSLVAVFCVFTAGQVHAQNLCFDLMGKANPTAEQQKIIGKCQAIHSGTCQDAIKLANEICTDDKEDGFRDIRENICAVQVLISNFGFYGVSDRGEYILVETEFRNANGSAHLFHKLSCKSFDIRE